MSFNHTENCDLTELRFSTLLNNISDCQYFDVPFNDPTSSIHNVVQFPFFMSILDP